MPWRRGRGKRDENGGGRARDGRERERKRGELDLIDKVDLSAAFYVHLAPFFRLRPLARDPRSSGTIRFLHDPTLSAT